MISFGMIIDDKWLDENRSEFKKRGDDDDLGGLCTPDIEIKDVTLTFADDGSCELSGQTSNGEIYFDLNFNLSDIRCPSGAQSSNQGVGIVIDNYRKQLKNENE